MGAAKNIPTNPQVLFLPYQQAWVDDRSRLKLMEKSRQIGLSWATAYAAVERTAVDGAQHDQWVSSRDDLQARLFLEDCKWFSGMLSMAANDLGEQVVDEAKNSAYVLGFQSGKRIHSMSSNPDAQAGKRGGRILDEFALHPDPRKLYSIAYPGITWGGQLEIVSTHRGSANLFAKLVDEIKHKGNPKGFSLHTVTLERALDEGFLYKLQTKIPADDERQDMDEQAYYDFIRSGCVDDESFQQEYCCVPADDAAAFLPYELIDANTYSGAEPWERSIEELRGGNDLYIGVDIGRRKDLTVIWVVEAVGDLRLTRQVIALDKLPFSVQEEILYPWLELPNVRRCCIDDTGLGMQFAERAQSRFGTYRIEAVTFSGPVKEELAYPVRSALEDHTFRLPDDRDVVADFRGIRKETTAAGNIRFTGESTERGHCDRFWAAALALHAGKTVGGKAHAAAVPTRSLPNSRKDW